MPVKALRHRHAALDCLMVLLYSVEHMGAGGLEPEHKSRKRGVTRLYVASSFQRRR